MRELATDVGFAATGQGRGLLPFDYDDDGDGDLDVLVVENAGVARLFENAGAEDRAWFGLGPDVFGDAPEVEVRVRFPRDGAEVVGRGVPVRREIVVVEP